MIDFARIQRVLSTSHTGEQPSPPPAVASVLENWPPHPRQVKEKRLNQTPTSQSHWQEKRKILSTTFLLVPRAPNQTSHFPIGLINKRTDTRACTTVTADWPRILALPEREKECEGEGGGVVTQLNDKGRRDQGMYMLPHCR